MAAAIETTATTIEGQLFEIVGAMQAQEVTKAAADPNFSPLVTLATDAEGGTVSVAATLPATVTSAAGTLSFTPTPYL